MKNAHGVEPTRFMKKKESRNTIRCLTGWGPQFGYDICINKICNEENSCWIINNGTKNYECHPEYKSSLFVNTNRPDKRNKFTVLDYEVFGIENYKEYIYNLCKYPDIIWRYIETKDISEESLKQFDDDIELLNDLNTIDCDDSALQLKISQCCLKNPSEFLPDTQIVNKRYDDKLREWCGDYKWRLLYRASEHGFTNKSFHECCDDKGPILIVIKSTGGWIFGSYTISSRNSLNMWECIYDMIY